MSNEAITAISKSLIRPSGRKFVAMALADFADENWSCYPSVAQLAEYTAQGEKTVRDHLDGLEKDGIISRNRQRREDGTLGRYRFFIQRRNLPMANIARGENPTEPAADFATQNPHIEPSYSLSETSSDAQKPAKKRNSYPEPFEALWKAYPTDANMSKKEAFDAWKRLDGDDRNTALASVPAFVAYCKAHPDYRPIHLCRFLTKRRFDGHGSGGGGTAPNGRKFATVAEVFIAKDSKLSTEELRREWIKRLEFCRRNRIWNTDMMGAPPGKDGCRVPDELLTDHDRRFAWDIEFYKGAA